jgi:non-specific serine/threonine protein kinase/serine/threonine-protein kinase
MAADWAAVKSLLEECLEAPPAERLRCLENSCADPALRDEVASLLTAHDGATDFLEEAGPDQGRFLSAFYSGALAGHRIGAYRLEEEIGRGGMGTVYRAVRDDDEFQMVVAIKIVSRGMDTDMVLRRFRTERQILASLDHPNIARILDGGSTESGLPYFVMEYVPGRPLTDFCDQERLTVTERVRLFRKVCAAVSYAHKNRVVHRDLKPGNILVTADGTPKLLDFGIAKIVTGGDDELTATGPAMATPAYASPEQIRGEMAGPASDIYSLGVILYELLTGHRPYRLPTRDSDQLARVICEREPTRASTVVAIREHLEQSEGTTVTVDPVEISDTRRTTVEALQKRLRGDLDTVVSVALRKEPNRRYSSVDHFSEDLARFLEGMPIEARRDSLRYRASKYLERHPMGIAFGTLGVLLLCAVSFYAFWEARRLSRRMAEDHQLASTFLVEVHDAIANLPGATPAREKLLRKSLDYLNSLTRDAGEDPELHRALATAYEKFAELQGGTTGVGLGRSHEALESSRKAQAIREALAKNSSDPRVQYELANNYILTAFLIGRVANPTERLEYDLKALTIAERLYQRDPKRQEYIDLLAQSHTSAGYGLTSMDRFDESRKHFQRALTLRTNALPQAADGRRARRDLARIHYRLGAGYAQSGQASQAIGYLRQALEIQEPIYRATPNDESVSAEIAATFHFLAVSLRDVGEVAESIETFNKAIAIREASLERDPQNLRSRSLLAGNHAERGTAYAKAERMPEALRDLRRALELETAITEVDPLGSATRFALADFQRRLGALYATMAKRASGAAADQHWRESARFFRRADALYVALSRQGLLNSTQLRTWAKEAAEGAAEAARHAPAATPVEASQGRGYKDQQGQSPAQPSLSGLRSTR